MEDTVKKFKRMGTTQLVNKIEKLSGSEKEVCIEILKQRGQDISKWTIYEAEPETPLTSKEEAIIAKAEKDFDKEKKAEKKAEQIQVLASQPPKKVRATILSFTPEQQRFVDEGILSLQKGLTTKKELVLDWVNYGIAKQQIDKFVDPTVVSWSFAYPIYKANGK